MALELLNGPPPRPLRPVGGEWHPNTQDRKDIMRNVSRRELIAAGAGMVPFAGLAAVAAAQQGDTAADAAADRDALFASCLLIIGRKQIEVCRFALDRLQHQ